MSLKGFLSFQDTNYLRQSNASTIYDPRIIILTANHWHVAKQFFSSKFFYLLRYFGLMEPNWTSSSNRWYSSQKCYCRNYVSNVFTLSFSPCLAFFHVKYLLYIFIIIIHILRVNILCIICRFRFLFGMYMFKRILIYAL